MSIPGRRDADGSKRPEKARIMRIFSRLNIGGPSIHVVLLSAGLDPDLYETRLIVGREGEREGSFVALAESKGVRPEILSSLGRDIRFVGDVASLVHLYRFMRRYRPCIVHTHTAKAGALGRVAAWLAGVPVVVHTFHGTVFEGYFGATGSNLYSIAERCLARLTDVIIAISPRVADELHRRGLEPRDRIVTIPLGLELEAFVSSRRRPPAGLRRHLGVPENTPLIGSVGRLVPIKDIDTLLSAVSHIVANPAGARAHLVIAGDGPERARLESLSHALGVADRVHFLGFQSDLPGLMGQLDVVVNCSRNEGTPVAIIEAMAASVPVVATRVGGSPDLLQGGRLGQLVPSSDPLVLSQAIIASLSQTETQRHRTREAQAWVVAHYGAERLIEDIQTLYLDLLAARGHNLDPKVSGWPRSATTQIN